MCAAYGVPMLEDAAEALGSYHRGRAAGAFGAAAALSFNGNKIMTTSGGGMLLTDDRALADRARYLATQARQPVATTSTPTSATTTGCPTFWPPSAGPSCAASTT